MQRDQFVICDNCSELIQKGEPVCPSCGDGDNHSPPVSGKVIGFRRGGRGLRASKREREE